MKNPFIVLDNLEQITCGSCLKRWIGWTFLKPNYTIMIFYLIIAGGGFIVYAKSTFGIYIPNYYMASYHMWIATAIMFTAYFCFYKAATVNPGIIKTKIDANKAKKKYPFDEVMFKKDSKCKTCQTEKPARSKHCTI